MSGDPTLPPERELADDEEWDDDADEAQAPERPPRSLRRTVALAAGSLALAFVLVVIGVLSIPTVSDVLLLPRTGPDLVLGLADLPPGFRMDLDLAKTIDLGIDDSPLGLQKKAQLVAAGFGGGWVRTFESDAQTGLVNVTTGTNVYRGVDGAHLEWQRTIADLDRSGVWRRFSLGTEVGDEAVAYEQILRGAHATLVYYRYANILAVVSLTYAGAPDEAFKGAAKALSSLARAQTERERFARFRP